MKRFYKNKKGTDLMTLVLFIIVILVVVGMLLSKGGLPSFFNKLFGLKDTVANPYEACKNKADGDPCSAKDLQDGVCFESACVENNRPAISLEHAKSLFRTTFKKSLEACQKDVTKCESATVAMQNIVSFVDDDGEGNVYVTAKLFSIEKRVEFRLNRKLGFFSSIFNEPGMASFMYNGEMCFFPKGAVKNVEYVGIGQQPNGIKVFDVDNIANRDKWYTLLAIKHQPENDATKPVCFYAAEQ